MSRTSNPNSRLTTLQVHVFKKKRRKNYRRFNSHRQENLDYSHQLKNLTMCGFFVQDVTILKVDQIEVEGF